MGLKNDEGLAILGELATTIAARKGADTSQSYTASLLSGGVDKCARKFGEEAIEMILAAVSGNNDHTAAEAADVLYHFLVLLEASDVHLDTVLAGLRQRRGTTGHDEKASRAP